TSLRVINAERRTPSRIASALRRNSHTDGACFPGSFSLTGHTNGETNSTFSPRVRLSWERERRAKIINAEGEFQAARKNSCRRPRFPSATVRPATALLTDDEGNFERA